MQLPIVLLLLAAAMSSVMLTEATIDRATLLKALPSYYQTEEIFTTVPLFWHNATADPRTVTLWTLKISPAKGIPTQHLWMMQGGSGRGSLWLDIFEKVWTFDVAQLFNNDVAFLITDHRGTGFSTPLSCNETKGTTPASCARDLEAVWGRDGLAQFSETAAAMDLDFLIQTLSVPAVGPHWHIYSWSHGTYWVQRFLHIRTSDPETVTMDGVVSAPIGTLMDWDVQSDSIGKYLLTLCGADVWCSSQFQGQDPVVALHHLFDLIGDNNMTTCLPHLINRRVLQSLLSGLVGDTTTRLFIPPTLFRLLRCNSNDVMALTKLLSVVPMGSSIAGIPDLPVQYNQMTSELIQMNAPKTSPSSVYSIKPDFNELRRVDRSLLFSSHVADEWMEQLWNEWPRYPADQFWRQTPQFGNIPTLILNGDMDPYTPFSWASYLYHEIAVMQGHQSSVELVKMPYCSHGTVLGSPVVGSVVPCAMSVLASFVTSKGHHVADLSCVSHMAMPFDWQGVSPQVSQMSQMAFGTPDMWQL